MKPYTPTTPENSKRESLLVAQGNDSRILSLIPLLQHAGYDVSVLAPHNFMAHKQPNLKNKIYCPVDTKERIQTLRDHLREQETPYTWIILLDELLIEPLQKEASNSWISSWFPVPPQSPSHALINNRTAFSQALREWGVLTPAGGPVRSQNDAARMMHEIKGPVILKQHNTCAGLGIRKVTHPDELPSDRFFDGEKEIELQEYIQGKRGSTALLLHHGEIRWQASVLESNLAPPPFGPSTKTEIIEHKTLLEISEKIATKLRFHGFCGFDWLYEPTAQTFHVIEFHSRPPAWLCNTTLNQSDLPHALRELPLTRKTPNPLPPLKQGTCLYKYPHDIIRCIKNLDIKGLRQWMPKGKAWPTIPWTNPILLSYAPALLFIRSIRKRRQKHLTPP